MIETSTATRPRTGLTVATKTPPSRHRRDIEGLRAVAVLLVVAYHCDLSFFSGGYVGVDVFFVISGFLITGLLLREADRTGRISIPRFYARRALRLLPASAVVVVATVIASALWLPPLRLASIVSDALHTSVYAMNWRLAAVGTDYLNADADPSPLQHFWSLAVEEQFYLLWPLLIIAFRAKRAQAGVLIALTVVSLGLSLWQTRANAGWAYFGAHTRAWELGVGALLAVFALRLPRWCVPAGLLAVAASALVFTAQTPFPGYAALLPVLGTAAVIAGGTGNPAGILGHPALQGIGRLSYSWYLWHWPTLMIAPAMLGRPLAGWENVLVALGALVLAMFTYALVENPARHLTGLRNNPWRGIAAGLAISLLCAGLCVAVRVTADRARGVSTYQASALDDSTDLGRDIAASVAMPAVPANLTPALERVAEDLPHFYQEGCSGTFSDAEVKKPCAYGDLTSPTTVVLFGDSHAGMWFPALEKAALERHWKLVIVTKSACTAADGMIFSPQLKREFTECVEWRRSAWEYVRSLHPAKILLSSTYPSNELLDVPGTQDEAWVSAWQRSVQALSAPGTEVYFMTDTPWQAGPVPECLSAHMNSPAACGRSPEIALALPDRRQLVAEAVREAGAVVIDPVKWFCTPAFCPVIVGNVLVYRDQHHITTAYSELLAPQLGAALAAS
ncbi:SGNH hydrolase domain-containing protein [Winogradskya consettensis]|uniref:Acyltransferase n=1 Tax=Winogradskya consettensis TaxID=113560 RepID=A0A919SXL4_9ACTN|nr:acyltransferase family protein [Actinoplanes consettensis]GIM80210.1 acyltransferase [Actinoplanes consettensis]